MKQSLLTLIAGLLVITLFSQENKEVITGAGYVDDVYYSLTEGSLVTTPKDEWDLAFATNRYDVNILANHAGGVEVYLYPEGNTSSWNNVDVSNMANWPQLYNSIESLDEGAFLRHISPDDPFDFGWGKYNPASHVVKGDSLYIVKTIGGETKKLWIVEKNPNTGINKWQVKYANIDGSEEVTFNIEGENFIEKNFVYFSFVSGELLDREPVSADWEFKFTKYHDYSIPYNVTGVTVNSKRVMAYQVDGVDQLTYEDYDELLFNDSLIVIGSDWKSFTGMGYEVNENRVYFAKVYDAETSDSTYWKLYFTDFSGSSEGKYTFVQQQLGTSSNSEVNLNAEFEIYPNPATDQINIILDREGEFEISLSDLNGRKIMQKKAVISGFSNIVISTQELEKGYYLLSVSGKSGLSSKKFFRK